MKKIGEMTAQELRYELKRTGLSLEYVFGLYAMEVGYAG